MYSLIYHKKNKETTKIYRKDPTSHNIFHKDDQKKGIAKRDASIVSDKLSKERRSIHTRYEITKEME